MIFHTARKGVAPWIEETAPASPAAVIFAGSERAIQMTPAVPHQAEINVFVNENGAISIHQECGMDEPSIVEIHPQNLDSLIRALRQVKKNIKEEA